jgi:hypothetical protein
MKATNCITRTKRKRPECIQHTNEKRFLKRATWEKQLMKGKMTLRLEAINTMILINGRMNM